ncbi:Deoxyguanosine kinase [Stylophora pistillata]|uniref:Deoxyguanosine kinase n=1 Tax=Stylophora pistillata TaxID=50429 RepID=A0A2B4S1D1_STYPI|nr:Deoxyguanosine kinase [Stylophora pistillata]
MIGLRSKESNTATCKPQLVIVEGNIGVGKSTLSCQLARKLNYRVFLEPSAKNPYLAKFYKDPKKYALKLQLWIFKQRFRTYIAATKHVLQTGQGVLLDRSVFSDTVFAEVNFQQGTISSEGYEYYKDLKKKALQSVPIPHTTLYLDVSPETCTQRIHGRGRFLEEMRKVGSRVLEYNWTDFGYNFEVAEDIKNGVVSSWDEDNLHAFNKLVSDESLLKEALTLDRFVQEADISEDEEGDTSTKEPRSQPTCKFKQSTGTSNASSLQKLESCVES